MRLDYLKKTKYENQLPPPPFAPKLVDYDLSLDSLLTAGSLSSVFLQSEVEPEVDSELGIPIDLSSSLFGVDGGETSLVYNEAGDSVLDPEDADLLGDAEVSGVFAGTSKSSVASETGVSDGTSSEIGVGTSFLRRTVYMASDTRRTAKRKGVAGPHNAFHGSDLRKQIEQSFVEARKPLSALKHPKKPKVHAVSSEPLLPDAKVSDLSFVEVRLMGSASLQALPEKPSRAQLESSVFLHQRLPEEINTANANDWFSMFVPGSEEEAEKLHKQRSELRDTLSAEEAQAEEEANWPLKRVQDGDLTLLRPKTKFEEVVISHDPQSQTYLYVPVSARANLRRRRVDPKVQEELREMELDVDELDLSLKELTPQESIERDEVRSIYDPVKYG